MQSHKPKHKNEQQLSKSQFLFRWVGLQILVAVLASLLLVVLGVFLLSLIGTSEFYSIILGPLSIILALSLAQQFAFRAIKLKIAIEWILANCIAFLLSFLLSRNLNYTESLTTESHLNYIFAYSGLVLPFLIGQGIVLWRTLNITKVHRILIYLVYNLLSFFLVVTYFYTFKMSYFFCISSLFFLIIQGKIILWVLNDSSDSNFNFTQFKS